MFDYLCKKLNVFKGGDDFPLNLDPVQTSTGLISVFCKLGHLKGKGISNDRPDPPSSLTHIIYLYEFEVFSHPREIVLSFCHILLIAVLECMWVSCRKCSVVLQPFLLYLLYPIKSDVVHSSCPN